ncbi:MAG TPA: DUF1295 domain-containing protein [Caldisericia bacterium]|nr:DUF1295 domain-containing protein [Caldisericia bacterium]HPF49420.1 DUF1295 domain-containing protein [Caldisericia bacterium]HPI84377.1 DUF1295 domain-containing protein [Caldisericia bacterium]HPQ93591.1 DUF1295 domain-containing protein [Caldisericia bacterium]HRV75560.1 DUF1295 domain-containing protein [Caldisericia bacterium]
MREETLYLWLSVAMLCAAVAVLVLLFFISAPYGRHRRGGWGPQLSNKLSWIIMESPSALGMASLFVLGGGWRSIPCIIFFLMWEAHYLHRAFIYPLMLRDGAMPASVIAMGFVFNLANAYLNGRGVFTLGTYSLSWLIDPRFILGLAVFICGFAINRWADEKLRLLREPGEKEYKIPYGGLYEYVSCPNYLGEIIEWTGWAIATWSLGGAVFAFWTLANLLPRAVSHHRWYREHFEDYPKGRKAIVPRIL